LLFVSLLSALWLLIIVSGVLGGVSVFVDSAESDVTSMPSDLCHCILLVVFIVDWVVNLYSTSCVVYTVMDEASIHSSAVGGCVCGINVT
jgi:hypothetical protein